MARRKQTVKMHKTSKGFEVREYGQAVTFPWMEKHDARNLVRKLRKHRKAGSPIT